MSSYDALWSTVYRDMQEYAVFLCLQQEDMHSSALYGSMEYHVLVHALRSPLWYDPTPGITIPVVVMRYAVRAMLSSL